MKLATDLMKRLGMKPLLLSKMTPKLWFSKLHGLFVWALVTVLECLMPEMMTGLVDAYKSSNVHKKGSHKPMSAAVMSLETREMMRSRLEPEYQVYNFVKQRLQAQYQHCLVNKASWWWRLSWWWWILNHKSSSLFFYSFYTFFSCLWFLLSTAAETLKWEKILGVKLTAWKLVFSIECHSASSFSQI